LVDDQKTVEEFAADGADEALGDRVRSRCVLTSWMSMAANGVEGGGELVVAVADQDPKRRCTSSR
jgi:hypothetical protein